MTGTHRDITARKEAELALEIRNRIAEVFLTSSDQRIYIDTLELVCNATNSPAGLFGVLDVAGNLELRALRRDDDGQQIDPKPPERLQADQLPPLFQQVIRDLHSVIVDRPGQATGILDDATLLVVPVTTREQVIGVIGVAGRRQPYDSSDRTLLESLSGYLAPILQSRITSEAKATQLRQAQKMEALGALAGGIAHDFNNILQAIMGFTTLARDEIKPGSTTEKDLNRVLRATHRGQELVKRILLFSRRQEQDRQPVEMEAIVQEAVGLLRPSIPATIEVRTIIDPRTGMVLADPSQLSQVVLNLATNAYHAMETDGGVLEIEVGFQLADAQALDRPDFLLDKDLVVLTVRDNGCGMESEVLSRLYDPFFTTKEVGKGTGLGLSVVHGIVASHGGDIQIESDRGAGTTVRIMLPRLSQEAGEIEERSPSPEDDAPGGHILFVDDEDDIAAMGQALLEKQGFKVTVALNGATALDNLLADAHDYDLLITDLTMPRMTGLQLADKVAEVRPDLPVLLISGFGDRTDEALKTHPHIWGVINKPFGGETLRRTVKQTLQAAAERQSRSRADGE